MPRLTPESLAELWEVLQAKTDELVARDAGDPRAEQVVLFTAGLPLAPDPVSGPDSPTAPDPGRAAVSAGPDATDAGAADAGAPDVPAAGDAS